MSRHPDLDLRAPGGALFVAGAWTPAADGQTFTTVSPATSEPIRDLARAGAADVDRAVAAADAAARGPWHDLGPHARASALLELARRIEADAARLTLIDVVDGGSTTHSMRKDAGTAVEMIRFYAGLSRDLLGRTVPLPGGAFGYTLREPYGVVATIVPFNHPLMFAAQMIGVALAAGNAIVLKPSEYTPLSTLEVAKLAQDLVPPGTINILTGYGAECGAPLVDHPKVRRVHFKGSVATGKVVMRACAERLVDVTLELGGKSPFIVCPDVDVATAVSGAVTGLNLIHQGQSCGSATRLFVHESIMDEFRDRLVAQFATVKPGLPWLPESGMGSLVDRKQYDRVLSFIEDGRDSGAKLLTGGNALTTGEYADGLFIEPTIFDQVPPDASIAREEVFGPVTCLFSWRTEDEVVAAANDTEFGLTASVWTRDDTRARRIAEKLESGFVWINNHGPRPVGMPFGGYKQSGIGRERSLEELLGYTQIKSVLSAPSVNSPRSA